MRRIALILMIWLPFACGCAVLSEDPVSGYLFTHTTLPYTVDLNNTPVVSGSGKGTVLRVREPFTNAGLYTELNSNAIGDIGKKHGLQKVYFADLETFSIFTVWRSHTLILYGE